MISRSFRENFKQSFFLKEQPLSKSSWGKGNLKILNKHVKYFHISFLKQLRNTMCTHILYVNKMVKCWKEIIWISFLYVNVQRYHIWGISNNCLILQFLVHYTTYIFRSIRNKEVGFQVHFIWFDGLNSGSTIFPVGCRIFSFQLKIVPKARKFKYMENSWIFLFPLKI